MAGNGGVRDSQRTRVLRALNDAEDDWSSLDVPMRYSVKSASQFIDDIQKSTWYENYHPPVCEPQNGVYWKLRDVAGWNQFRLRTPVIKVLYIPKSKRPKYHRIRSVANTPVYADGGTGEIHMPRTGVTLLELVWCLSGILAIERPQHGRQFCAVFLEVVERWVSFEAAMIVRSKYTKYRVKFGRA